MTGEAGEASEREVRPFPGRGVGLGTADGQPRAVRETIGFAAVCASVGRCFRLSVDVLDLPLQFPTALESLETPLGGNGQVSMQKFRGNNEGYTYLGMLQREGSVLPLLFANGEGTGS